MLINILQQPLVIQGEGAEAMAALLFMFLVVGFLYLIGTALAESGFWRIMFLIGIVVALLSFAGMLPMVDGNGNYTGMSDPLIQRGDGR